MGKKWHSQNGQSILSEYTMVFFIVIAVVVAISVYVQRSFEGRIHDARNFAIDAVANSDVCDANCLMATGGVVKHEYEPYYTQMAASSQQNQDQTFTATSGNAQVIGAIYGHNEKVATQSNAVTNQLPPEAANET
jgi:hypothetical protein